MITEADADTLNSAVARPKPGCPKCGGSGSHFEPSREEQLQQIAAGTRKITSQRMCDCYDSGRSEPRRWERCPSTV